LNRDLGFPPSGDCLCKLDDRNTNRPRLPQPLRVFYQGGYPLPNICLDDFLTTLWADAYRNILNKDELAFDPELLRDLLLCHLLAADVAFTVIIIRFVFFHAFTLQGR